MLASGPTPTCAIMAETDENGSLDWKILSATTTPRQFAASSGHRFSPLTIPQEGLLKSQSTYGFHEIHEILAEIMLNFSEHGGPVLDEHRKDGSEARDDFPDLYIPVCDFWTDGRQATKR
ncbi:hypothetical protein MCOR02_011086 [Pyricularia oryzae]|uniref:Uncharacterized protein n=1 Tax=Pyricularia grisea TaxID=148305 RepID=A0ABQ8NK78_PYRGI|nr:hypothetical protein MCOR02_011086 [Pyricularia oryzae]KAI6298342.1 hypothetical protein MCOR33_005509 [Pyricularia grisea]KAI6262783.1 hypothetical protein MCOR19_000949 [Pyricularia oryzae]KAI6310459.1 hypothetical protein MCOR34_006363 [Pyricularia oryzae]KAI6404385.1 hypothetical protein MCOR23_003062 [Pyricularia oryzae]